MNEETITNKKKFKVLVKYEQEIECLLQFETIQS